MFIYRWIKRLVFVAVIVALTLYFADHQYKGKTLLQHFHEAKASGLISEGMADLKTWFGDLFNMGKKAATDQISAVDKEKLEAVIKNELKDNISKIKEEAEKAGVKAPEQDNTKK